MILARLVGKEMKRRPGRAILTLLSIVLGVAAVLSVSLAIDNAHLAYEEMYRTLAGRAALEVAAVDGSSFPETLVAELDRVPGVRAAVPTWQGLTTLLHRGAQIRVMVLGIDLAKDRELRDADLVDGRYLDQAPGCLLDAGMAAALGIRPGDEVRLRTKTRPFTRSVPVVGLLAPRGASGFSQAGAVFLPLPVAQEWSNLRGRVNTIGLVLDERADEQAVAREVTGRLPEGLTVRTPAARSRVPRSSLRMAEHGLNFGSALVVVLGVFIILNTLLMNLSERRRQLAILRAIGATRRQIGRMILGEALVLGLVGTALGCVAGMLGARFVFGAIAQAQGAAPPPLRFSAGPFVLAALVGPLVSLAAAWLPTRIAGRIPPLEGIRPVVSVDRADVPRRIVWTSLAACALGGVVLVACILGWAPAEYSIPSGIVFLVCFVPAFPVLLRPIAPRLAALLRPLLGVEGRLGCVQLLRRSARTGLTAGVLFIAISTGIGLGTTIINNVEDVRQWYRRTMVGDFFVRAMFLNTELGRPVPMPENLRDEIARIDGVANVDTISVLDGQLGEAPVTVVVREFTDPGTLPIALAEGKPEDVRRRLFEGETVLGTVPAHRMGLKPGDQVELRTSTGPKRLQIAGTAIEYTLGGNVLYLERASAAKILPVEGVDVFLVRADPEKRDEVGRQLKALTEARGLMLHNEAELSALLDAVMTGVVRSLWGVLALGCLIAGFGVANTLTMNVLEQTREIALLRVVAMTRRQVRKMVLGQATILGLLGLISGTLAGVSSAWFIKQSMVPLLGYEIAFVIHPGLLLGGFAAGLVIVLAAAILPAERAARLNLLIALQYE
ncbi:MAG: FtsX-like permease family protein [Thermoguttaceae bacterium]|jgi:putative ABC transport system permease protein|nr:FtsX-like permease family protein [Thermoguttaceae bacterium]